MGYHEIPVKGSDQPIAFMQRDAVLKAATDTELEVRGVRFVPNPRVELAEDDQRHGNHWETRRATVSRLNASVENAGRPRIALESIGDFQPPISPRMLGLLRRFKNFVLPERVKSDLQILDEMDGTVQ
jgi:hypothetical protein